MITAAVVIAAVIGVIAAGLFVWLGIMTSKGRNWARITATVLLALALIFGLFSLGTTIAALLIVNLVQVILAAGTLVALFLGPSNEYFRAGAQPA